MSRGPSWVGGREAASDTEAIVERSLGRTRGRGAAGSSGEARVAGASEEVVEAGWGDRMTRESPAVFSEARGPRP